MLCLAGIPIRAVIKTHIPFLPRCAYRKWFVLWPFYFKKIINRFLPLIFEKYYFGEKLLLPLQSLGQFKTVRQIVVPKLSRSARFDGPQFSLSSIIINSIHSMTNDVKEHLAIMSSKKNHLGKKWCTILRPNYL